MSVSSHLTPEPERRLWIILDNMGRAVEWTDVKVAALTAFAAAELAGLKLLGSAGALDRLTAGLLGAALPLGVFAFAALERTPRWLPFLEPPKDKPSVDDCLVAVDDVARNTHGELIHRLDRYLGGGITATQYYEDIVGLIVARARTAWRKQRVLRLLALVVGLGQLALLARIAAR